MIRLSHFLILYIIVAANMLAQAGTVSGNIKFSKSTKSKRIAVEKYIGKISGKVAKPPAYQAGVWLTQKGLSAPKSKKNQTFPQKNYQFSNHLKVISKGTAVMFPNEDIDHHNIYSLSKAKRFDLGRYRKNETPIPTVVFDKIGFVTLKCEIHEHMQAYLIVVDSPYFTETDNNGAFKIENIPAGTYTLHAQVNKKMKWSTTVVVTANGTSNIRLPNKK